MRATSPTCSPAILDRQRLGLEAMAAAVVAGRGVLIAPQFITDPCRIGVAPAPLHIRNDAFERAGRRVATIAVIVMKGYALAVRSVKDGVADLFGQVLERLVCAHLVMVREAVEGLCIILRRRSRPRGDGAFGPAKAPIGHDHVRVEIHVGAQAVARRAGTKRIVERKQPRLNLLDGEARHRARELRRKDRPLAIVGVFGDSQPVSGQQGRFETIGKAGAQVALDHEAVDDDLRCRAWSFC